MRLLDARFKLKRSPDELKDILLDRWKHIPSKPFLEIITAIVDSAKAFPTPKDVRDAWYAWKQAHPEATAKRTPTPCKACNGSGLLAFRSMVDGLGDRLYESSCGCAYCDNSYYLESKFLRTRKRYTIEQMLAKGWEPWPYNKKAPLRAPAITPRAAIEQKYGKEDKEKEKIRSASVRRYKIDEIPF